jgi:3' terminal RNA ribose 2'-O-methyltransferase Hen1
MLISFVLAMLLTITTSHRPTTDLGYLLHKNPARLHANDFSFGRAYVFYPEAAEERCTAALLLDVDPVGLVRGRRGPAGDTRLLEEYVNDRPYVASSYLSVALAKMFGTAMGGRSRERPELAELALPFEVNLSALPCRGGEEFVRRLFEPLGYRVETGAHPLDEKFPNWGPSRYLTVRLEAVVRLRDLLTHLYVLIPVLDDEKHYWVGEDEVDKLLRRGAGWLAGHPEREAITRRYLKYQSRLTREALARLTEEDEPDPDDAAEQHASEEAALESRLEARERIPLAELRIGAVLAALKGAGARRVLDLGCGEGRLLRALLTEKSFEEIVGVDVSHRVLEIAADRLRLERLAPKQRERFRLLHGSLVYRDKRLEGYDAAVVMEVIEHLDPPRLASFERVVFENARPLTVVITTPNVEYNVKFESLPAGRLRHRDHRFEWARAQFHDWASNVSERSGYRVRFVPIGPEDPLVGAPTQMGVFTRTDGTAD